VPSTNFDAAKQFVEFGLGEQAAGRRESASGPHGTNQATAPFREMLLATLRQHDIRTVLDLGCGDWNWMRQVGFPHPLGSTERTISYQGWDAHEGMMVRLNETYGGPHVSFHTKDITTEEYPRVDLIIARSVLFHIDAAIARRMVERVRAASKFFLSNSFLNVRKNSNIKKYLPIDGWGFYTINLNIAPFNLGPFMIDSAEELSSGQKRYACLYKF
jgi:hypothetical protein